MWVVLSCRKRLRKDFLKIMGLADKHVLPHPPTYACWHLDRYRAYSPLLTKLNNVSNTDIPIVVYIIFMQFKCFFSPNKCMTQILWLNLNLHFLLLKWCVWKCIKLTQRNTCVNMFIELKGFFQCSLCLVHNGYNLILVRYYYM